jgi:hypothetical protein
LFVGQLYAYLHATGLELYIPFSKKIVKLNALERMISSFAHVCKELMYIFEDVAATESNSLSFASCDWAC